MENHSNKKKVLIICYSFPPYPGIGGRRWAKFAKYFAQQNIECHVINATNHFNKSSEWTEDVKHENIHIHSVPFRFKYLMTYMSNGLPYRIAAKLLRLGVGFTKYSPHFYTSLSKKQLLKKCNKLIKKHNIKTVITSGDPYIYYYSSLLKKNNNIRLILDYRDSWNDHSYYTDYLVLSKKQRVFWEYTENSALQCADLIVGVYDIILNDLKKRRPGADGLFKLIPNGFDIDDYQGISITKNPHKKITLYMGGSVSYGAHYVMENFLQAFNSIKETQNTLWNDFEICIEGQYPPSFEKFVKQLNAPNIILRPGIINRNEYMTKLADSDYGMILNMQDYKDALFRTKTYDYFYLRKPFIVIGPEGKVARFAEENKIGLGYYTDKGTDSLAFFTKLRDTTNTFTYSHELTEFIEKNYNISNLAKTYLREIR